MTTTWSDHTVASAISRLQSSQETALPERNRTGRCATPKAPRPALLLRRANKAQINPELYSSLDERWGSGHFESAFERRIFVEVSLWRILLSSDPPVAPGDL